MVELKKYLLAVLPVSTWMGCDYLVSTQGKSALLSTEMWLKRLCANKTFSKFFILSTPRELDTLFKQIPS
jgi:hypothetical protein